MKALLFDRPTLHHEKTPKLLWQLEIALPNDPVLTLGSSFIADSQYPFIDYIMLGHTHSALLQLLMNEPTLWSQKTLALWAVHLCELI